MPTHNGHPYLLEESSESHTTPMDPQQIASMFAEIIVKLEALKTFNESLTRVEATSDQIP